MKAYNLEDFRHRAPNRERLGERTRTLMRKANLFRY